MKEVKTKGFTGESSSLQFSLQFFRYHSNVAKTQAADIYNYNINSLCKSLCSF